ncbi:glutathione S-transferase [Xylariaceae sp. FL1651]|nr:glutathione S-transferase [Xylariaceae sp. FL1651]
MSSSTMKPIKLYGHWGPNPTKVATILEELNLPYEISHVEFADVKGPAYTAVNPNGRVPAIYDPNTGLTLWESGAIIEYLVEKYDTARKLSFAPGSNEYYLARQFMAFQISGQGPYFGNAIYFKRFAPEPNPNAVARFVKEINRVAGVVESVLSEQKKKHAGSGAEGEGPWLVGGRLSYADLAFWVWFHLTALQLEKDQYDVDQYPLVKEWLGKMAARKTTSEVLKRFMPPQ